MAEYEELKTRVQELAARDWDRTGIEARYKKLGQSGVPTKSLEKDEIISGKKEILDRVQLWGEEYEYFSHSCAKGSALAVMEEFGLGNMEIIKAMSPFPGFGMTGGICGAVTGGLISLGLYFGSEDMLDFEATGRTMAAARKFIQRFKEEFGTISCPEIQEKVVFGKYMDPRASQENFEAFVKEGGYEKCSLPPGIGARIAAGIIIEDLEEASSGN